MAHGDNARLTRTSNARDRLEKCRAEDGVDTSNPPVTADVPASAAVKGILRRACYDCHSNETQWPWYGRIAPVSWLLARDVREGRAELNFSTWNQYSTQQRVKKLKESWEEVAKPRDVPPPAHRRSRRRLAR